MRLRASLLLLLLGASAAVLAVPELQEPSGSPGFDLIVHRGYYEIIPGTPLRLHMVAIPGGAYRMGSPEGEQGRDPGEGPRPRVRVGAFWMSKTEITWEVYDEYRKGETRNEGDNEAAVRRNSDAITRPTPTYPDEYRGWGKGGMPVVGLSHHAAMEFCHWLSRKTGRAYRLPTEAEWEWAARAGTDTPWFFGSDAAKLKEYAWYDDNSNEQTHPVGTKKPNPWGLADMYGNVAEWCLDHYQKDDYAGLATREFLLAPVRRPTDRRYAHVVRGGSWADAPARCRSASRRGSDPSWNKVDPFLPKTIWWQWDADFVGFRIVRAVEEQPELVGLRSRVTRWSR
jgi:formylglycine-generating enzyme required for sulfatase activity